jgi:hypothetical protein
VWRRIAVIYLRDQKAKPASLSKSAGVESSVYFARIENKYPDTSENRQITPR